MKFYPNFIVISSVLFFPISAFTAIDENMPHIGHYDQSISYPLHKVFENFPPIHLPNRHLDQVGNKALIQKYYQFANSGNSRAQLMLGLIYLNGVGVPKSSNIAKNWFKQACENGYEKGCYFYRYVDEYNGQLK